MYVAEIWRCPVKSMAGKRLDRVEIGPLGLDGIESSKLRIGADVS